MNYTTIPGTELKVAMICLGSTSIGSTLNQEDSFKLLDAYEEAGGNFVDTANVYANWLPGERSVSEKMIGRWLRLRGNRAEVIIATKGAHPELKTMHISRLSRAEIEHDLNDSLKNLQVETIDLYWLHRDDPKQPVGEILETLNDQVKTGKIRYFGCSNWWPARIAAAQAYAAEHGFQGFVANQVMWSLAPVDPAAIRDKTSVWMDEATWQYHRETGLAAIPYTSQAHGLFQRLEQGTLAQMEAYPRSIYRLEESQQRFERVKELAAERGLSVSQVVLGYLLSQPFTTIPIVGCRTLAQLQDSLTAAEVKLESDQVAYLEGRGKAGSGD
jgi:aryl-alcohol dehydrogenase-like predicted oxidoreductase